MKLTAKERQNRVSSGQKLAWARRKARQELEEFIMAYRPKWFEEKSHGRTVLGMALDLHTGITGSGDTDYRMMATEFWLLTYVVEHWHRTVHDAWVGFDTAVLNLLLAVLAEAKEYQEANVHFKEAIANVNSGLMLDAVVEAAEEL